jgi:branched-chain amino acid transport system substrate-binding protein
MTRGRTARFLSVLLAFALLSAGACSQRDDDDAGTETDAGGGEEASIPTEDCATDPAAEVEGDTIKLVSSFPQSGLTAAFSEIARGWRAYFSMLNDEEGGVDFAGSTYTVETDDMDDEYNPELTRTNVEELVGTDGEDAFATFSVVGTANNVAIRELLGDLCVPNLFAATGSPAWANPDFPWTLGSTLSPYTLEGQRFAEFLSEEKPDATVAMLIQNDDFGAAYEEGFKEAIEGTDIELVEVQEYASGSSDVASEVTSLANTDADAFFNGATLLACPEALTRAKEANWDAITWVSSTCISKTLMGVAGEAADGVYSFTNIKDPLDPQWDDDEAMQLYRETVGQYEPEADVDNGIVAYGWTQAAVLAEAMAQAESPSRLGLMEALRDLQGIEDVGLLLPGVSLDTSADDLFLGEEVQLVQYGFEGPDARNHFTMVGELTDYEGQTVEFTPPDLISG